MKYLLLLLVVLVSFSLATAPARKQLAGLPSHFESHHVPKPAVKIEQSAFLKAQLVEGEESLLNRANKRLVYSTEIPVDAEAPLQFSFSSPLMRSLELTLLSPKGHQINLEKYLKSENWHLGDSTEKSVPINTYFIEDITETGFYMLSVSTKQHKTPEERKKIFSESAHQCVIIFYNYDDIEIETTLNSYLLKVGQDIGLHAQILVNGKTTTQLGNKGDVTIKNADMLVEDPNGIEIDIPMHDDGLNGDKLKNDHIFTATVSASAPGVYKLSAVLRGVVQDEKGEEQPFLKTAEHTFIVSDQSVEIGNDAWISKSQHKNRVNVNIAVAFDEGITSHSDLGSFRAYTEVYGVDNNGQVKPAAWIGSIVDVQQPNNHGSPFVSLEFDLNWLAHANLKGPLTLKNTYLADAGTEYPVTIHNDVINVRNSKVQNDEAFKHVLSVRGPIAITKEMKFGVNPLKSIKVNASAPDLILLHGYCSDVNPFEKNANQFTNAAFFLNKNANVNNHDFALMVYDFAEKLGSSVFSLIGHSQGGMAALHLYNHYWTGLDLAHGKGTLIQAVGTPWGGNSAAGSTANLGKLFGVGCGQNNDLTVDGAKNWLTGIHEDHPEAVAYYTTSYKRGGFFGDYCNLAINAILQWPNDGTTELKYAKLEGGNDMGNKEGQCHTTGMKYSAQYYDNARNAVLNKNAARHK